MIKFSQFLNEEIVPTNIPLWKRSKSKTEEKKVRHDLAMKDDFVDILTKHNFQENGDTVSVSPADLVTYQSTLIKEKLDKFIKKEKSKSLPVVYELADGTKLLHDGNHRVAAAIQRKDETINVELRKLA